MRQRFRIRELMGLVLASGPGLAALAKPTVIGVRIAFSAALLATLTAALGAAVGRGPARARCVGFAMMAGATLVLGLGPWCIANVAPHLASTAAIDWAYERLEVGPELEFVFDQATPGVPGGPPRGTLTLTNPGFLTQKDYRRLGHSLLALVLGLVGAMIGSQFARSDDEDRR